MDGVFEAELFEWGSLIPLAHAFCRPSEVLWDCCYIYYFCCCCLRKTGWIFVESPRMMVVANLIQS